MRTSDNHTERTDDTAGQLYRSALKLFRALRVARPESGLSITKLSVLARLHQEGVSTASALAAYLRIQPQSMTRLIADLERQGLISRRPDAADRRQSLIRITAEGATTLSDEAREQQSRLDRIITQSLTPAERGILRLAAELMDRLTNDFDSETGR